VIRAFWNDALPKNLREQLKANAANLDDAANTASLFNLNPVVVKSRASSQACAKDAMIVSESGRK
jgi:hypothetical protein